MNDLARRPALVVCLALLLPWAGGPLARAQPAPPALMLARSHAPGIHLPDYWVSEKLDGVRGHWTGSQLLSRGGTVIAAPAWFTAGWPAVPIAAKATQRPSRRVQGPRSARPRSRSSLRRRSSPPAARPRSPRRPPRR